MSANVPRLILKPRTTGFNCQRSDYVVQISQFEEHWQLKPKYLSWSPGLDTFSTRRRNHYSLTNGYSDRMLCSLWFRLHISIRRGLVIGTKGSGFEFHPAYIFVLKWKIYSACKNIKSFADSNALYSKRYKYCQAFTFL